MKKLLTSFSVAEKSLSRCRPAFQRYLCCQIFPSGKNRSSKGEQCQVETPYITKI
jgi:hypothetical protein